MKLWGGRFTKETNQLVHNFNASLSFDQKFYKQDIDGSIAHVNMLAKQNIVTNEERFAILNALEQIKADIESGTLEISSQYEDIHSFVEATLIERIGDTGKKLHTGRSRNDQVALDMRLYTRDEVVETDNLLKELLKVILRIMKENVDTYMPGFTHLQKAQPVTVAHHFGAYFEMFKRDRSRLSDIYERMNYCPLGAGALAGTTYDTDRYMTAQKLGFDGITLNSIDGVSDRDFSDSEQVWCRIAGLSDGHVPDCLRIYGIPVYGALLRPVFASVCWVSGTSFSSFMLSTSSSCSFVFFFSSCSFCCSRYASSHPGFTMRGTLS